MQNGIVRESATRVAYRLELGIAELSHRQEKTSIVQRKVLQVFKIIIIHIDVRSTRDHSRKPLIQVSGIPLFINLS